MAIKRKLRSPVEIRKLIEESGIKYIMINNRIFDLYKAEKVEYSLKMIQKDSKKNIKEDHYIDLAGNKYSYQEGQGIKGSTTFDERDFVIFILLNFLDLLEFKGYSKEVADYLGYSDKRVKERIKKLQFIQGDTNSYFYRKTQERQYVDENDLSKRGILRFIDEKKETGYENGKRLSINRWYVHWGCDYKKENKEVNGSVQQVDVPISFFPVTIYDLDLLTDGLLNENEFITYLLTVKSYNSGKNDTVNYSMRALAENLGIKIEATVEKYINRLLDLRVKDQFCEEGQDFPLVHRKTNQNHQRKLATRSEPSYKYIPVYNITMMQRLRGEGVEYPSDPKEATPLMDNDETNTDTNFIVDSDLSNEVIKELF